MCKYEHYSLLRLTPPRIKETSRLVAIRDVYHIVDKKLDSCLR